MLLTSISVILCLMCFLGLCIEKNEQAINVAKRFGSILAMTYFGIVCFSGIKGAIVLNEALVASTVIGLFLSVCLLINELKKFK